MERGGQVPSVGAKHLGRCGATRADVHSLSAKAKYGMRSKILKHEATKIVASDARGPFELAGATHTKMSPARMLLGTQYRALPPSAVGPLRNVKLDSIRSLNFGEFCPCVHFTLLSKQQMKCLPGCTRAAQPPAHVGSRAADNKFSA